METTHNTTNLTARIGIAILTLAGGMMVIFMTSLFRDYSSTYWVNRATINLDLTSTTLGAILLVPAIISIILHPVGGLTADFIGRRKIAVAGLFFLVLGAALSMIVKSPVTLALMYASLAIGAALILPSLVALMFNDIGSKWLLATAASCYLILSPISMIIGTLFYGLAVREGTIVAIGVPILIALTGISIGMVLVGISYFLLRKYQLEGFLPATGEPWKLLSLGLGLPAILLVSWPIVTLTTFLTLYARNQFGSSYTEIATNINLFGGFALMIEAGVILIAGPLADGLDWLSARFMKRKVGRLAVAVMGIAILCLGLAILLSVGSLSGVRSIQIVTAVGSGLVTAPLLAVIIDGVPRRWWATLIGVFLSLGAIGNILVSLLGGLIVDRWSFTPLFGMMIAFGLLALILVVILLISEFMRRIPEQSAI